MPGKAAGRSGWDSRALLGCTLVLFLLLSARLAPVPLERDEGEYAYIAWLMGEGGIPYKDVFNQKPPGAFLAYRLIMSLFGGTVSGIHWGAHIWTAATAVLVFAAGRRLLSDSAGVFAAALYCASVLSPGLMGQAANTETFMALPLAAAALLAWRARENGAPARDVFVCGLLVGLATIFKQVALADGLFILAWLAWLPRGAGKGVSSLLRRTGLFTAGGVCVWLPVIGFLALRGGLADFYRDAVLFNLDYAGSLTTEGRLANLTATLGNSLIPHLWPLMLIVAFGLLWLRRPPARGLRRQGVFCAAWLLFALLGAGMSGHFREHYFIQPLAPAALSGAALLDAVWSALGRRAIAAAIPAVMAVSPVLVDAPWYFALSAAEYSRALYGENPFAESPAVAQAIRESSAPGDRVLVVGSEPQILFHARRRSASRYILTYPMMMDVPGAAERQREFCADAASARPGIIVVVNVRQSHLYGPWTSPYLFETLNPLLAAHYRQIYPAAQGPGVPPPVMAFQRSP